MSSTSQKRTHLSSPLRTSEATEEAVVTTRIKKKTTTFCLQRIALPCHSSPSSGNSAPHRSWKRDSAALLVGKPGKSLSSSILEHNWPSSVLCQIFVVGCRCLVASATKPGRINAHCLEELKLRRLEWAEVGWRDLRMKIIQNIFLMNFPWLRTRTSPYYRSWVAYRVWSWFRWSRLGKFGFSILELSCLVIIFIVIVIVDAKVQRLRFSLNSNDILEGTSKCNRRNVLRIDGREIMLISAREIRRKCRGRLRPDVRAGSLVGKDCMFT